MHRLLRSSESNFTWKGNEDTNPSQTPISHHSHWFRRSKKFATANHQLNEIVGPTHLQYCNHHPNFPSITLTNVSACHLSFISMKSFVPNISHQHSLNISMPHSRKFPGRQISFPSWVPPILEHPSLLLPVIYIAHANGLYDCLCKRQTRKGKETNGNSTI